MKKLYDLAVKTREYTDRDGKTKGVWQNVGVCMEGDDGNKFITLEKWFNPAGVETKQGKSSIIVSMFKPRENDGQGSAPAARPAPARAPAPVDDDIPF